LKCNDIFEARMQAEVAADLELERNATGIGHELHNSPAAGYEPLRLVFN
jgi:hypothetical protein